MTEDEAMGTLEFGRFFCTGGRSVGAGFLVGNFCRNSQMINF
jgi:hypothetical protein